MASSAAPTDTQSEIPADIAKLSFEEALKALETIVSQLDSGSVSLEQSIEIYSRGTLLKRHCDAKLRAAKERIDKIVVGPDGAIGTEPANLD